MASSQCIYIMQGYVDHSRLVLHPNKRKVEQKMWKIKIETNKKYINKNKQTNKLRDFSP
jgi:hypothetical protein